MTEMNETTERRLAGKAAEEWKTLCDIIDDIDGDWRNDGEHGEQWKDTAARRIAAGLTPRDQIVKVIDTLEFCVTVADPVERDAIIPTLDSLRTWDTYARLLGHTVPEADWEHKIPAQLDRMCQGMPGTTQGDSRITNITLRRILGWACGEMITVSKRLATEDYTR